MIQVLVSAHPGHMGTEICKAVDGADDMTRRRRRSGCDRRHHHRLG